MKYPTRQTLLSITIETVVMGRDVARSVEAVTVRINVVTADILHASILPITDVAGRTIFVFLTTYFPFLVQTKEFFFQGRFAS